MRRNTLSAIAALCILAAYPLAAVADSHLPAAPDQHPCITLLATNVHTEFAALAHSLAPEQKRPIEPADTEPLLDAVERAAAALFSDTDVVVLAFRHCKSFLTRNGRHAAECPAAVTLLNTGLPEYHPDDPDRMSVLGPHASSHALTLATRSAHDTREDPGSVSTLECWHVQR